MSTGSFSSATSLMTSMSTTCKSSSSSSRALLAWFVFSACLSIVAMCLSRSILIWWRSSAMAEPRSLEHPRKNFSVLTRPSPVSSSSSCSHKRSFMGISSSCILSRTTGSFTAACSSSASSSPLLSVSARRNISLNESMTSVSILCFSFAFFSSVTREVERVFSTMTPTIVFSKARTAVQRKAIKTTTIEGCLLIKGPATESDQRSPVKTWKSEYIDLGTSPQ
mmetsp:Transcript_48402/g.134551  ORF Transcript_48402/g.134551 Transcript_48402/m.134551 type:complete len:223 (+) Transcript_48402:458-1126(+)